MKLVLAITAALLCSTAEAATVRMYTPGGAPCAGACTYDWAVEKFDVPRGEPMRMVIPVGSYVTKMSYAKEGVAYAFDDSAILAEDEPGEGYYFQDAEGVTFLMAKLDKCENWSVMMPPGVTASAVDNPAIVPSIRAVTYAGFYIPTGGGHPQVGIDPQPPVPIDPEEPSPVPLPVSAIFLLLGLGALGGIRSTKAFAA